MEWLSNARYDQTAESGSVFSLKGLPFLKIHKYRGCGEALFLSCAPLGIDARDLGTELYDVAVKSAQEIIANRLNELSAAYSPFVNDKTSNNLFVRG